MSWQSSYSVGWGDIDISFHGIPVSIPTWSRESFSGGWEEDQSPPSQSQNSQRVILSEKGWQTIICLLAHRSRKCISTHVLDKEECQFWLGVSQFIAFQLQIHFSVFVHDHELDTLSISPLQLSMVLCFVSRGRWRDIAGGGGFSCWLLSARFGFFLALDACLMCSANMWDIQSYTVLYSPSVTSVPQPRPDDYFSWLS